MTHPLNRKKPARQIINIDPGVDDDGNQQPPITLTLRALSRKRWDKLITQHHATDDQKAEYRQKQLDAGVRLGNIRDVVWNPDTFPAALTAACVIDPPTPLEVAVEMWDPDNESWTDAEVEEIFSALLIVNQRPNSVTLGKELRRMLDSAPS